jgi:hypothetical protein
LWVSARPITRASGTTTPICVATLAAVAMVSFAGAGAQRGGGGQQHRAGDLARTGYDQNVAAHFLVGVGGRHRQAPFAQRAGGDVAVHDLGAAGRSG